MEVRMKERGLTLIEILVSMGVLAFGLIALLNLNIATLKMNASGSDLPSAMMLAEDLINQMKTWNLNDPRLRDSNPGNNDPAAITNLDPSNPSAEHNEDELLAGYNGIIPCSDSFKGILCSLDKTTPYFRRFWNVWDRDMNGDGINDTKIIVVFVVFTTASGFPGSTMVTTSLSLM
jgi:Tfp pilus assembly protein PilV